MFEPLTLFEPIVRVGLTSGDDMDQNTIQGVSRTARGEGMILRWGASYGSSSDGARFAGIWFPNVDNLLWNHDGLHRDG